MSIYVFSAFCNKKRGKHGTKHWKKTAQAHQTRVQGVAPHVYIYIYLYKFLLLFHVPRCFSATIYSAHPWRAKITQSGSFCGDAQIHSSEIWTATSLCTGQALPQWHLAVNCHWHLSCFDWSHWPAWPTWPTWPVPLQAQMLVDACPESAAVRCGRSAK